jgi:transcriptional regulator with XRE-family HTH domain
MNIKELLDSVKKAKGIESHYALAKYLNIPTPRISDYYNGKRNPDEYACLQIAKALGKSYEEISAYIHMKAEKNEKRRSVWKEFYREIGGMAAGIAGVNFIASALSYYLLF